jgi:hypothetical protein
MSDATHVLNNFSDAQLLAEIQKRHSERKELHRLENISFIELIRSAKPEELDWIKHTCNNCTDNNLINDFVDNGAVRCVRCFVIDRRIDREYLDSNLQAVLTISSRP